MLRDVFWWFTVLWLVISLDHLIYGELPAHIKRIIENEIGAKSLKTLK